MESPKVLCKIDKDVIRKRGELKGVSFTKRRLVAYYERNYNTVKPAKKIMYFKKPNLRNYPIDLNVGFDTFIRRQSSSAPSELECILKYAMSSEDKIYNSDNVDKIKIFTRRGTLATIMCCYYRKEKFTVRVCRYNGDLYMARVPITFCKFRPANTHHEQFLKNVFTESPKDKPKINEPCDENKLLIGVHQSSLGKFDILYSGLMQGIQTNVEFKDIDDLEALDACRWVMAKQMWFSKKKDHLKMLDYWLQAYLSNATDLYFAYKDFKGFVQRPIVHKFVCELPKEYESNWRPNICTTFLYKCLEEINKLLSNDNVNCIKTVYEFNFDSDDCTITYNICKEDPENFNLLSPDYMEYCKNRFN
ncbi:hypothetical protein DOY81_003122 [Sarcophaga bullata]|nr:hypothetical protein DOY81_003122 [Sarcophaga bullata]